MGPPLIHSRCFIDTFRVNFLRPYVISLHLRLSVLSPSDDCLSAAENIAHVCLNTPSPCHISNPHPDPLALSLSSIPGPSAICDDAPVLHDGIYEERTSPSGTNTADCDAHHAECSDITSSVIQGHNDGALGSASTVLSNLGLDFGLGSFPPDRSTGQIADQSANTTLLRTQSTTIAMTRALLTATTTTMMTATTLTATTTTTTLTATTTMTTLTATTTTTTITATTTPTFHLG